MARSEHKRQQKLKARKDQRKIAACNRLQRQTLTSELSRLELAVTHNWPVVHARVADTIWTDGIGPVALARRGPQGTHVISVFLVDAWCLGVKDAFVWVGEEGAAREKLRETWRNDPDPRDESPAYVRKLVENAIGYALDLGLAPHPDSGLAQLIFGDIDPGECRVEFEFGRDGQPHYVAGPRESHARMRQVVETLQKSCGPGNFHFVLPVAAHTLSAGMISNDDRLLYEDDEIEDDRDDSTGDYPLLEDRRMTG